MNEPKPDQSTGATGLRWFRIAMLLLFVFAAYQFFAALSWGAYGFPLLALLGVGLALLPGIIFVAFGIVAGVLLGWMVTLLNFCKRCVRA